MLGDLFYQMGATLGGLAAHLPGKAGAAPAFHDLDDPDIDDDEAFDNDGFPAPAQLVRGAAGAWLLGRLLRPRRVSWPRVIIAGVAATALSELARRTVERELYDRDRLPDEDPERLMARFGAGLALAAGYASLLYPRIPGTPLMKGLAFGALEIAAAPHGGLARLAATIPGLRYPLQGLAHTVYSLDDEQGPIASMAFGLGLGLFYRHD